ncbi:MAG: rRNA maturation RNase YbeY [Pseudomonadota bacterium]
MQYAVPEHGLPAPAAVRRWAAAALGDARAEVTVRIVDADESAALNQTYRHKSGPTNVLSFPFEAPVTARATARRYLGDIVICAPVVEREARVQHKSREAHWAHMLVHGCLHLLGHDHQHEDQAQIMEALETRILASLGYPDPYLVTEAV